MSSMKCINKFLLVVLATLTSLSSSLEEFYCKAVDGCEINARCDPSPFSWAYLKRNDFPIKCVRNDACKEKCRKDEVKVLESKVENLTKVVDELRKDKKKLEDGFAILRSEFEFTTKLVAFCNVRSGLLYNGNCLWEEERPERMTIEEAFRKCNNVAPSKLPEFYNQEQYNQVWKFLKDKMPSGETYIQTWIGLTRDHWTGNAYLFNGERAPYVKLKGNREKWIDGSYDRTNAYLDARKSLPSKFDGVGATSPATTFEKDVAILLCQTLPLSFESKFKIEEDEVWCQNIGGIAYNGSCLWAEDAPRDLTLSRALEVCNNRTHSKLPEVYGGQEYIEIMEYIRTKSKCRCNVFMAWTGMTRNRKTNQAMLSDGSPAPYTKPRSHDGLWNDATDDRVYVYLAAGQDTSDSDQGMGALWPTYKINDEMVFCQKL